MHTSTVSFGLIYSLKTYFVRNIDAKEKFYLNFKLDEVLKVQTTRWRLNYRSGQCLEASYPALHNADVAWTCWAGRRYEFNTVMQIENMLNKYGWQSQKHKCGQECGLISEYKCLKNAIFIIFKDPTKTQGDVKVLHYKRRKAEGPLFSANYMTFDKKMKMIKLLSSKINLRYSSFLGFFLDSIWSGSQERIKQDKHPFFLNVFLWTRAKLSERICIFLRWCFKLHEWEVWRVAPAAQWLFNVLWEQRAPTLLPLPQIMPSKAFGSLT